MNEFLASAKNYTRQEVRKKNGYLSINLYGHGNSKNFTTLILYFSLVASKMALE